MSENISSIFEQQYCCETLPERITQQYEVLSCLKYTETRQVYLLRHRSSYEKAILKCSSGKSGELLRCEYDIISMLYSEGIECNALLRPIDYFFEDDIHFYIREYAEGRTLASYVEKGRLFSTSEACLMLAELCSTVHILHTHKPSIICRDINPGNVLICPDGSVRIIDLDSARRYNASATSDTVWVGTKEMAAPEQFGYSQTNTRTDIYVLGMLLLYITTGSYDKYSMIPPRLKKVIEKSTAFNPEERYATVLDMRKALLRRPHPSMITAAAVLLLSALFLSASAFINASHLKAEIPQERASSEHISMSSLGMTSSSTTPATPTTTAATISAETSQPQTTVTTTTTTPAMTTTTAMSTTAPTAANTTSASGQLSPPKEIPADGEWHKGEDGAFYFVHENKEDSIPTLEIDTSHITDWSKIKTVYADVLSTNGNSDIFLCMITDGQYKQTEGVGGKNHTWTLHIDTNGGTITSLGLRGWWAEANTVIKISNIIFSEEEYVAPEYGAWHTNTDGSYTYKQGDFNGSGDTTPALQGLIPEEGLADDWSRIYALSADIEVTGGEAWLLVRGNLDGSYFLGMDKTFKNESGSILYITNGKQLGSNGFDIMCWYITPYTEIKVSNIRYILK